MSKTALITGIGGQDGYYMSELLKSKGYNVVSLHRGYQDFYQNLLYAIVQNKADEVYNFAAVSNVFDPYDDTSETLKVNAGLPAKILEAIRRCQNQSGRAVKFFQASSSLIFGSGNNQCPHENSMRVPAYPYGAAKLYADNLVRMYRQDYGIFAVSGIFFNHTSPKQSNRFFWKKVTDAAKKGEFIELSNLSVVRDIGYAPDYMEAAYLMMQAAEPKDYIIGTGRLIQLKYFVDTCFAKAGRDWRGFVKQDESMQRILQPLIKADTSKIFKDLGWKPKHNIDDIIEILMQ